MVVSDHAEPSPAVFSHHAISSATEAAPSTSMSPSPSMSAAWTEPALSKSPSMVVSVEAKETVVPLMGAVRLPPSDTGSLLSGSP